jgi:hypothetical protein
MCQPTWLGNLGKASRLFMLIKISESQEKERFFRLCGLKVAKNRASFTKRPETPHFAGLRETFRL